MDSLKVILLCITITSLDVVLAENKTQKASNQTIELEFVSTETLQCRVTRLSGNKAFTLTWYKGTQAISQENRTTTTMGETISFPFKLEAGPEATGAYRCEVTYESESMSSKSVLVNRDNSYLKLYLPERKLKPPPMSLRINETTTTTFYVKCIVSSYPRATVSFSRHGETLTLENARVSITSSEQGETVTHVLTITNVTYRDASEYICRASNGIMSETIKANFIYLKGQECANELVATQQQIKCPTNEKCVSRSTCSSSIHDCIKYSCERPDTPADAKIVRCTHNAAEIQWTRDDKAKNYIIYVDTAGESSYTLRSVGSDIIATGLTSDQEYTFTVSANNKVGVSNEEIQLKCKTTRLEPPSQVQNAEVSHHENGLTFGWDLPKDDGINTDKTTKVNSKLQYKVKYCPQQQNMAKEDPALCKSYVTNQTFFPVPIKDIETDSYYKFMVVPVNAGGKSGKAHITYYRVPSNLNSMALYRESNLLLLIFVILMSTLLNKAFYD